MKPGVHRNRVYVADLTHLASLFEVFEKRFQLWGVGPVFTPQEFGGLFGAVCQRGERLFVWRHSARGVFRDFFFAWFSVS
jgi:hypothetical protein